MSGTSALSKPESWGTGTIKFPRFSFINSSKIWGGEERFILDLAAALTGRGCEVRLYGRPEKEFLRRAAGVGLATFPLYVNFDYDPRPLWRLPAASEEEAFVAVTPRDFKLLCMLAFLRPQAKFFWHLGVCYPVNNWEYRWLLKNKNIALVVPSEFLRSEISASFPNLAPRISVLPNGIELPPVDSEADRKKLSLRYGVPFHNLFLGVFSRLVPGKGHSLLFQALRQVKDAGVDFHLWILGEGERSGFEGEAARLGLGAATTFVGYQADVSPWMAGVDVVLFPSEKESFGYVALEGMALGKAVLASEAGALPEVIQNGTDGILVGSSDPAVWANAIVELSRNPQKRDALGRAGKASVERKFSLKKMVADFLKVVDAHPPVRRP